MLEIIRHALSRDVSGHYICLIIVFLSLFFFFNDTATTEIYTLSLHDALPISGRGTRPAGPRRNRAPSGRATRAWRSEEHTSELQSHSDLVCRLLLEKKKKKDDIQSVV